MSGLFGVVGLLVAAVGLFGAVSFDLARRRREFGIRMALGASRAQIRWLALRDNSLTIWTGLGLGLSGSLVAARLLRGVLYGLTATEPLGFAVATAVLLACAGVTAWLSTRHATEVEPADVLR